MLCLNAQERGHVLAAYTLSHTWDLSAEAFVQNQDAYYQRQAGSFLVTLLR